MMSYDAFISGKANRVVYWGTDSEKITDHYTLDSFGTTELIESSVLLYGNDIRNQLKAPEFNELYADVKHHYDTIRKYAQKTGRSIYSFGWILDIARCIYTLHTGKIIAKTAAGQWALENNLCPVPDILKTALNVRKSPFEFKTDESTLNYAQMLGEPIQKFVDVLKRIGKKRGVKMLFGIPTLIETNTLKDCAVLCKDLNLDFIELNMNLPQYQLQNIDVSHFNDVANKYGIFYTIHLDENLNISDFNSYIADGYRRTVVETIALAKDLGVSIINMHLSRGV